MSTPTPPSRSSIRQVRSLLGASAWQSTHRFIRRAIWLPPVLAIIALAFAGTWLRARIERAITDQKQSELTALLKADVEALQLWLRMRAESAEIIAEDPDVRDALRQLALEADRGASGGQLLQSTARKQLDAALKPWLDSNTYFGYVVSSPTHQILAADPDTLVGQTVRMGQPGFVEKLLSGEAAVSRPVPSKVMMPDETGEMAVGVPVMFAGAPVFRDDASKEVAAIIAIRIRPREFTNILSVARSGDTGETYAFDDQGLLLSNSRFEDDLKRLALMPDQPTARSALYLDLRDPGVDLVAGERSAAARKDLPLTELVAEAIKNKPALADPAVNIAGYRDYRGSPSIGAAVWLPEQDFGVLTEIDIAEAFGPVRILRSVFWTLFGLLGAVAALLLGLTWFTRRLEGRMQRAVLAAGKLGQYALEEKIGEGGMGSVYRARHAMLRRPTAVKLLEPGKTTETSIARFEREVQLTSQLNHPNTITVYDFGRTNEGIFYYAMEFLEGFSLDALVQRFGPQPDGRVIQVLLQVCGSLEEAHGQGLIHRDIKPANIMLTRQGGVSDFVKLLDFGLVKAVDSHKMRTLTAADSITGTPLYMAPESISDPDGCDARGDLYALGAVGYFLLTGKPVFDTGGVMEIMRSHVEARPIAPSKRLARPMSRQLEQLILKCLEKSPADRPQSATDMIAVLRECVAEQPWTPADAAAWWNEHQPTVTTIATAAATAATQDLYVANTIGYSAVKKP